MKKNTFSIFGFVLLMRFIKAEIELKNSEPAIFQNYEMFENVLNHLKIDKLPSFTKEEYLNFEVPIHVKKRYDDLVWKHKLGNGLKNLLKRRKRSEEPSLAGLFKSVRQNPSISGDIVYSGTFREKLQFDMQGRVPERSKITMAQLKLFKKLPNFNRRLSSFNRLHSLSSSNRRYNSRRDGWHPSVVRHARVSVYHTLTRVDGLEESKLIDSRMIMVNGSGWQSFDITKAVKQWQEHPVKFMLITLELRIEGSRPGKAAAEIARMVRFTGQQVASSSPRRPELVVFTEEEEKTSTYNCRSNSKKKSKSRCCREKHFVNFREMAWTQYWIVEPAGYEAFKCSGKCMPSKRKSSPGAPRSCSVAESSPLPVMYLVKRGDVTEVEISEFPNMVVEKCGCSLDSLFVG